MIHTGINKLTTSKSILPGKKFLTKPMMNNFCKENIKLKAVKEAVTEKVEKVKNCKDQSAKKSQRSSFLDKNASSAYSIKTMKNSTQPDMIKKSMFDL